MGDVPEVVTLHLWGVPVHRVPGAVTRMATHRALVLRGPGRPGFAKLLGTGDGRTFTVRDADPRHWGMLATWDRAADAEAFERGRVVRSWARVAEERLRVTLRPLTSRGEWSRRRPFGEPVPTRYDGPVAALTRARITARRSATFWRSVPPVSADLHRSTGLRLAVGIGEAPVGLQGTFSLWDSAGSLTDFAHRRAPHQEVVRRTAELGWYSEELFARFAVLDVEGTFGGADAVTELLPMVFTSGWASGVNAYATVLVLGLIGRIGGVESIPDGLQRTDVLVAAAILYALEFVTDKIPYVDSTWDAVHTAIRPTVGAVIALLVSGDADSLETAVLTATGGLTALASHLVKGGLRLAVNTSPEPASNVAVSVAEDGAVAGLVSLVVVAPWLAAAIAATLLVVGGGLVVLLASRIRRALRRRRERRAARTDPP